MGSGSALQSKHPTRAESLSPLRSASRTGETGIGTQDVSVTAMGASAGRTQQDCGLTARGVDDWCTHTHTTHTTHAHTRTAHTHTRTAHTHIIRSPLLTEMKCEVS